MRRFLRQVVAAVLVCSFTACSLDRQVSQPNFTSVPAPDRKVCETEVRQVPPVSIQPRWLPPIGSGGAFTNGVILGTVDMPHSIWPSREIYQQEIGRCLEAHVYEPHG